MTDHGMTTMHASRAQVIYTIEDIERIERTIASTPVPARPLTTADALAALAPALSKARAKGHSLALLVQLCQQQGLHASERAISRILAKKPPKKKPSK